MDIIKGLPRLAYDMDYGIRDGCVFDSKIFDKYLVKEAMNYGQDIVVEKRRPLFI